MKKSYSAPKVYLEKLQAAVLTAGTSCANNASSQEPKDIPGLGPVFTTTASGCLYTVNTPEDISNLGIPDDDTFCYQNPNDATRMFAS